VRAVVANPSASVGKRAAVFADGHLPALPIKPARSAERLENKFYTVPCRA